MTEQISDTVAIGYRSLVVVPDGIGGVDDYVGQQLLLGPDVAVQGRHLHTDGRRDLAHGRSVVATLGEKSQRSVTDVVEARSASHTALAVGPRDMQVNDVDILASAR